jgi:single-strand DNA-binding protein
MAYDNTVTIVGNLTRDPELRFTPGGAAVANFGVAWNQKGRDGAEDKVSFFDVTCWRQLAENVSDSLTKGARVVIHGRLDQRSWENQEGEKRSKVEVVADDVAPSLKWATVELTKNEYRGPDGGGGQGGGGQGGGSPRPAANEPAPAPAYDMNEEPF